MAEILKRNVKRQQMQANERQNAGNLCVTCLVGSVRRVGGFRWFVRMRGEGVLFLAPVNSLVNCQIACFCVLVVRVCSSLFLDYSRYVIKNVLFLNA